MGKIRPATDADIPRIRDLYDELAIVTTAAEEARKPSTDDYRQVLAEIYAMPGHELLVIEDRGQVAGTMVLLVVPNLSHAASPWALIENLIVDKRFRGRGLARQLMEYAIRRAREEGCYKIALSSDRRRRQAHSLYRSLGFEASAYGFRLYL